MSKIDFPCPECGKWIRVPTKHGGRKGKCPSCKQPTRVPERSLERIKLKVDGLNVKRIEVAIAADTPEGIRQLTLDPFLEWVSSYVGQAEFSDGQTLQFGWTLLKCQVENARLRLLAPDMRSFPISFQADLTQAVWTTFKHKEVPASFDVPADSLDIPTLRQSAVVGPKFEEFPCLMERSPPNAPTDSGWTFNSMRPEVDNNDPDGLGLMSLYEVVVKNPFFLRYLSLPPGFVVCFRPEESRTALHYLERRPIDPSPGSYLAQTLAAEAQA
jgi:DNA-directed RNA polymerase subunit M/transcription elongation factor TFIIS